MMAKHYNNRITVSCINDAKSDFAFCEDKLLLEISFTGFERPLAKWRVHEEGGVVLSNCGK